MHTTLRDAGLFQYKLETRIILEILIRFSLHIDLVSGSVGVDAYQ